MSGLQQSSIKIYRMTDVYYHRIQVMYLWPSSDYVYRTFKVFFNSIRKYLLYNDVSSSLKKYSKKFLDGWYLNDNVRWNGRVYRFGIAHSDLGIIMFSKSLNEDKPVTIAFWGTPWDERNDFGFARADESNHLELGPEPTVIQVSKRWDKDTKRTLGTQVLIYFTGDPGKGYDIKILEWILSLMYRPIEWRGVAERRLVRVEQFVRVSSEREEDVRRALDWILDRYGIEDQDNWKSNGRLYEDGNGDKRRVNKVHRVMSCYFSSGYRVDVKIYRKKKFKLPEEHYSDHPKIEVVHYNVNWEDIEKVKHEGREILASIIEFANAYDDVIPDPDHPVAGKALANPLLVKSFVVEELLDRFKLSEKFMKMKIDLLDWALLGELMRKNLDSSDLKEIAEKWNTPIRTLRYHMKKLEERGFVLKFKTKKNKWVYIFNADSFRLKENEIEKSVVEQVSLDEVAYHAARAELEKLRLDKNSRLLQTYVLIRSGYNTTRAISKILGISDRQVRNYLTILKEKGLVESKRVGKSVFYYLADYESSMIRARALEGEDLGLGSGVFPDGNGEVFEFGGSEGRAQETEKAAGSGAELAGKADAMGQSQLPGGLGDSVDEGRAGPDGERSGLDPGRLQKIQAKDRG